MTRTELAHVVRAICSVLGIQEIWVVGSQSILATFSEQQLPVALTVSIEADVFVLDWSQRDEDQIEATLGEVSKFAETHGYFADPVSKKTVHAPAGWESRVVPFYNDLTKDAPHGIWKCTILQFQNWQRDERRIGPMSVSWLKAS